MTKSRITSRRAKSSGGVSVRTTASGLLRYEARVSIIHSETGTRRQVGKTFASRAERSDG